MNSSADVSTSTTNPNPLQDDDLSELTKKEILFWARKLKLSPTELFALSKQELEQHLERVQQEERYEEQRKSQFEKLERLTEMRRFLLEEEQRLKGGGTPVRRNILDILCAAANEIASMYGDSQEEFTNSGGGGGGGYSGASGSSTCPYSDSGGANYASSSFGGFKTPPIPNMCSTIYDMHPEDSQYTPPDFPSTLSATPISYRSAQRRNATFDVRRPTNATYNVQQSMGAANANATYNFCAARNATFDMTRAGNATYNIRPPQNATYQVPRSANATYSVCKQAPNATYNVSQSNANATYNVPQQRTTNATYNVRPLHATYNVTAGGRNQTFNVASPQERPNVTFDVYPRTANASTSFRPNAAMASTPKNCPHTGRKQYFRNYTDYSMTLSDAGIDEASQSVSYDVFSDQKSMVRAAARTYSIPNRSKSCPPSERTRNVTSTSAERSGSSIPCPRGAPRTRSPICSATPVQAFAAPNYGYTPVARPAADRSYGSPRRLCQCKKTGFCECERRSTSVPPR